MHERVSIHSVCFPTAGLKALGEHWDALGARRVSLYSGQLLGDDLATARAMLEAGARRVETVTHVFRTGALATPGADVEADRGRLSQAIAAASALGARSIYMLTGGRGAMQWEEAAEAFAGAIAPCVREARDAGVALAIENTAPFYADAHIATNLRDTITLAEIAGIGVCMDFFACWTEAGLREQIRRAMPRCVLVQVSDYVLGDRAMPCRAVPGDGAISWPVLLEWLLDAGYSGAFDLELLGPRIDAEGQVEAVRRAADAVGDMLVSLGVRSAVA